MAALESKLKQNKDIRLSIVLDYNRGLRQDKDSYSSFDILKGLPASIEQSQNVRIGFFKPLAGKLHFKSGTNSGIDEVFGVHHLKSFIFDDHMLVSGANLSESYFTERQDRYMLFKNSEALCDYVQDAIDIVLDNSYILSEDGELKKAGQVQEKTPRILRISQADKETLKHQFSMFCFSNRIEQMVKTILLWFLKLLCFEQAAQRLL